MRRTRRRQSASLIHFESVERRILFADVLAVQLSRQQFFFQEDATTVTPNEGLAFGTSAAAFVSSESSIISSSLIIPTSPATTDILTSDGADLTYSVNTPFESQAEMDAAYPPNGTYQLKINTAHDGNKTYNLSFGGTAYPSTPRVTNYNSLQLANAANALQINWTPMTGGTANDFIGFSFIDGDDNTFQSPSFYMPGALTGTATSITVPAGTLKPGTSYFASITFGKRAQLNTTAYPGAPGYVFVAKSTGFEFETAGDPWTGAISGIVFNDPNSNGVQDGAETGIGDWMLYLDKNNNNVFDMNEPSTFTDGLGRYTFAALDNGTYRVRQVLASGYRKTLPGSGVPGYTAVVSNGQETSGINFGNTTNILLAGKVFNDANGNGVQDGGEAGIAGVTVDIRSNNVTVATRTTDATGAWQVKGLSAGTGEAVIVIPAGKTATYPAGGKYTGSMSSGQQNANLNFGLKNSAPAPQFFTASGAIISAADSRLDSLEESLLDAYQL